MFLVNYWIKCSWHKPLFKIHGLKKPRPIYKLLWIPTYVIQCQNRQCVLQFVWFFLHSPDWSNVAKISSQKRFFLFVLVRSGLCLIQSAVIRCMCLNDLLGSDLIMSCICASIQTPTAATKKVVIHNMVRLRCFLLLKKFSHTIVNTRWRQIVRHHYLASLLLLMYGDCFKNIIFISFIDFS